MRLLTAGMETDTIMGSVMRYRSLPAFALVSALAACAAEDPGIPPFAVIVEDGSAGGASSVSAATSNGTATMTTVNAVSSTATVSSVTSNSTTGSAMGATATTGNPLGGSTTGASSTIGGGTATVTTGNATNASVTASSATTGGRITASTGSSTTGGAACTNVRPTGTEWDEATCDQWASETSECNMAWMVDNNYCNESCGRCMTGPFGGL